MDEHEEHQAEGVGYDVALAALELLAGVVAGDPAAPVVFTDWLSMTPAVGDASRPASSRAAITRRWLIDCQSPMLRQS